MPRGKVKYVNSRRGYAFIKADDGSPDMFLPFSAVDSGEDPKLFDIVEYKVGISNRDGRPIAVNVKILGLYDTAVPPQPYRNPTFDGRISE